MKRLRIAPWLVVGTLTASLSCGEGVLGLEDVTTIVVTATSRTLTALGQNQQFTGEARTASGEKVPGIPFSWSSSDNGVATVSASGMVTAVSNGSASISATADGISGSVGVTVAQEPGQLAFSVQPTDAIAGESVAPAVAVEIQDALGSLVGGASDAVTLAIGTDPSGGSATLAGAGPVGAVNGIATFSNVSVDVAAAGYTLLATSGTLTSATSDPFDLTAGTATQLVFTVQPSNTTAGATMTQVVVTAQDGLGNTDGSYGAAVTLTFANDGSGGTATLSGATATASNGVATFSTVSIDVAALGYTLQASDGTLTSAPSAPFAITVGTASAANSDAVVPNGTAGAATSIEIIVRDANDNPVTGEAANLALSVTGANTATPPQPTDNGDGTYTTSYTPTSAGSDQVAITLSGTAIGGSPYPSVVGVGGASAANSDAAVPNGTAGDPTSIVITVRDANLNLVTGEAANLALSVTGANTATPPQPTDNGDGTYTTSYTPTNAGSDAVAISLSGTPISGSPYASVVSVGAASAAASSAVVPNGTAGDPTSMVITVRDADLNPVTGEAANLALSVTGANTATPAQPADNGDGTYTTSYTPTNAGTDQVAITLSGTAIGGSPYPSVVSAGTATQLVFTVQPSDATAGATIVPVVEVTAQDALGNTDLDYAVPVLLAFENDASGGTAILSGATATAVNGVATFSNLSVDVAANGYTLFAGDGPRMSGPSAAFDITP
ncbi:MAG: Ig-like domain-containing protein, partial [Gemmatimonadota bacterium]|nr:Ig-like domain-containing protein [Gemmatimonadota bacterium]